MSGEDAIRDSLGKAKAPDGADGEACPVEALGHGPLFAGAAS